MKIYTQIHIEAKPKLVWAILMDFDNYPQWNPFIKSLTGKIQIGKTIKVNLSGMNFMPKIIALEKNKEFQWLGNLGFKGLFDGEHRFELLENPDGSTTFVHSEKFKGILVPILKKKLLKETKPGFEAMNLSLKNRVEGIKKG
ncbi:SRPBCC domain-containing protein [Echinicola jeungdonensis]|uniref:SRPBCC family protein n=1 Tax=Echinicola jeungdonensis TaxID=709343 RepID=A0ABV5J914_9BACT|nr:SRPBCC domain-containing protein [Echinicola jeungdonensis]MDN3669173.1 SRPBCC domain-containing protein [Echinicola jeungdonensis]